MNVQEFAELSAGHALGALSPDDRGRFLSALEEHPEWASIADADVRTAAALAESAPEIAPPVDVRSKLLRAIQTPAFTSAEPLGDAPDTTPDAATASDATADDEAALDDTVAIDRAPSTDMIQTVERGKWMRAMFGLVASMVLLVGVGWVAGGITNSLQTPAAVVALDEIEAAPDAQSVGVQLEDGGTATAHWSESLGRVVLVSQGLPELTDDQTFELWYVRGDQPVSAGTFDSEGTRTTVELEGELQAGDAIAVTVEPAGGSPDGAPTTDPIVVIPTA